MKNTTQYIFLYYFSILSLFSSLAFPTHALADNETFRSLQLLRGSKNTQSTANTDLTRVPITVEFTTLDDQNWAVLWIEIPKNYYTYAPQKIHTSKTENLGIPTTIYVTQEKSAHLPVYYPLPIMRHDFYEKDKIIPAYEGKNPFLLPLNDIKNPPDTTPYKAHIQLLLCSTQHCLPISQEITFTTPTHMTQKQNINIQELLKNSQRIDTQQATTPENDTIQETEGKQKESFQILLKNLIPHNFNPELEVTNLATALLLGLLAGIILNLMPCVLPVLSLKASTLLTHDSTKNLHNLRQHMLFFAAGIICQFTLLALLLAGAELMWGEFFQNTTFVTSMLVFIFTLALSLLGLFTLPVIDLKAGKSTSPRTQAFLTGAFTTLLATPCSGPLLGGVLSWAFLQPVYIIVCIFIAVGIGMSAPYLTLALKPTWATFLPKPGAWMHTLERFIAFFLLATTLYLFSILPTYMHIHTLTGLLLIAFTGWLWGHFGGLAAPPIRRRLLGTCFLCVVICLPLLASPAFSTLVEQNSKKNTKWIAFQGAHFEQQHGTHPILLEFTADWCPNCKFIEKSVFTPENMQGLHKEYQITFIQADITHNNPDAEAFLHALGGRSIPFTAIFPTGNAKNTPLILRDIYTKETLDEALKDILK